VEVKKGFWSDRPTFVTGGAGLVGSWLVKRLVEHGASVVCLVRDWVPESELMRSGSLPKVTVVRGDVRDQAAVERVLASTLSGALTPAMAFGSNFVDEVSR